MSPPARYQQSQMREKRVEANTMSPFGSHTGSVSVTARSLPPAPFSGNVMRTALRVARSIV